MELGLYVAVTDLARSKQFYGELFSAEPYVENDNFVGVPSSCPNSLATERSAVLTIVMRLRRPTAMWLPSTGWNAMSLLGPPSKRPRRVSLPVLVSNKVISVKLPSSSL